MNKKFSAFTLAEVLITLSIIGIVASMTIPTLLSQYQKTQYVSQLRKAYSVFIEAMTKMSTDYGCPGDLKCTGLFKTNDPAPFGAEIAKQFKVIKNCGVTTDQGCAPSNVAINYDGTNRQASYYNNASNYKFISADGAFYSVSSGGTNCQFGLGELAQYCGWLIVDVNGPNKQPNALGRDIFNFYIMNTKGPSLYPWGGPKTGDWWSDLGQCANSDVGGLYNNGEYCAGRIMDESWLMNY